jgi:hypothetical protein
MTKRPNAQSRGMLGPLGLVLAVTVAGASAVAGQEADRFDRVAGIKAESAQSFFQRLRGMVGRDERAGACGLIAYPLRHAEGDLASPSDCERRYDSVFTIAVRKAIGKQVFSDLFVNEQGIMIGLGEVWISGRCATPPCNEADLRIVAINSTTAGLVPPKGKVLLACHAAGQLVHVLADGASGAELRLWRSGRTADQPTVALSKAIDIQHDDLCDARGWTFVDGPVRYTASTLSCDAHLSPPPMGAVGELVVTREGMAETRVWCDQ